MESWVLLMLKWGFGAFCAVFGVRKSDFPEFCAWCGQLFFLRNQRKIGIFLHGFELVGIGVFTAGVAEDAGKPSTLFFDGKELGFTGRQVHSGGRMGFQASRHKRFPSGRVCCNDTHRQHHSCNLRSCRTSGKCQGLLCWSFSVELVGHLFDSLAAFAAFGCFG